LIKKTIEILELSFGHAKVVVDYPEGNLGHVDGVLNRRQERIIIGTKLPIWNSEECYGKRRHGEFKRSKLSMEAGFFNEEGTVYVEEQC